MEDDMVGELVQPDASGRLPRHPKPERATSATGAERPVRRRERERRTLAEAGKKKIGKKNSDNKETRHR
jgi:hypothetical protein